MRKIINEFIFPILLVYLFLLIIICLNNDYTLSMLLPLLPIIYGMGIYVIYNINKNLFEAKVILIVLAVNFFRLVVIPCIYILSGYSSIIKTSVGTEHLNTATLLLSFEFICTVIYFIKSKRCRRLNKFKIYEVENGKVGISKLPKIVIVVLICIVLGCILVDKRSLALVVTIFHRFTDTYDEAIGRRMIFLQLEDSAPLIFNLAFQSIFYLQVLIPAWIVSYTINHKVGTSINKRIFLSLLASMTAIIIITDNNIDSVCCLLACLVVVYSVYEKKMSKILPLMVIFFVGFVTTYLFAKTGIVSDDGLGLENISNTLCAYFASLPNVSCGFEVEYADKLKTFWGDIVSGVPYMTFFFRGLPKSVTLYNTVLHGRTGITNQIMPLISYGYQYLGIFAPLFTILEYCLAIYLEEKFLKTNVTFNKVLYAFMFINFSVGPSIFGFSNAIKRFCLYIPLFIIAYINDVNATKELFMMEKMNERKRN